MRKITFLFIEFVVNMSRDTHLSPIYCGVKLIGRVDANQGSKGDLEVLGGATVHKNLIVDGNLICGKDIMVNDLIVQGELVYTKEGIESEETEEEQTVTDFVFSVPQIGKLSVIRRFVKLPIADPNKHLSVVELKSDQDLMVDSRIIEPGKILLRFFNPSPKPLIKLTIAGKVAVI